MGIRFACHVCNKHLNIKQELAGRRGVCPACSARFRIPLQDAEKSIPIESKAAAATVGDDQLGNGAGRVADRDTQRSAPIDGKQPAHLNAVVSAGGPSVSLLDDDPEATWYVRPPSGGQYGPASADVLKQWINEGRVASTALLWRDGWPQWRDASEALPELAIHLPQGSVSETSTTPSKASPLQTESPQSPELAGQPTVGAQQRSRSMRRALLVSLLSVVALALIGVLIIVVNR